MHSVKLLFIVLLCSITAAAQYVQPMRYDHYSFTQQVNIGVGSARTTAASAYLEVGPATGATKGLIMPRVTTTLRDALVAPATGLVIYNSTTNRINYYNGSAWVDPTGSTYVDSVYSRNDSLFSFKNSTEYFVKKLQPFGTYLTPSDTANKYVTAVYRKTASDSVFYVKGGVHTFAFIDSTGGGGSVTYSNNPSEWLNTPTSQAERNFPEFHTSLPGDPPGSYYESSMYTPAPVKMNNEVLYTWTKGDLNKVIYGWRSTDNGNTWDTLGQTLSKGGSGTFDEFSIAMPMAHHIASTDSVYLYYAGIPAFPYENGGLGLAVAAGSAPNTMTKKKQALSIPDFKTQMGIGHNLIYISLGSIVKRGSEYYYYGGYWKGASGMTDSTIRIWEGHSSSLDTIMNCREVLAPTAQYTMYDMPTVFHGADSLWYMIFTKGFTDENGGIDSSAYLVSAVSNDIVSSNWTELPGRLYEHDVDSTWKGKRVYNAKLLKDEYGQPIPMQIDSAYGYPLDNDTEKYYMLFYSGSYTNSYHDQSSILYLVPQTGEDAFGIGYRGNNPSVVSRGGTTLINLPISDSAKNGILHKDDWTAFNNKAEPSGEVGYIWNNYGIPQTANLDITGSARAGSLVVGDYPYSKYGIIGADATMGMQTITHNFNIRSEAGLFFNSIQLQTRSSATTTTPYIFNSQHVSNYSTAITQNNYSTFNAGDIIYPTIPSPFNTTSSALTNYAASFVNYSRRESGSNPLTNVAARFTADSGQVKYTIYSQNGNIGVQTLADNGANGAINIGNATTAPTSNFSGASVYAENGKLKVRDGSGNVSIISISLLSTATGITLDDTHSIVNVTATGQTITLPAAAGITGRQYTIKLTASGSCTVDGNASETIDGATTYSLASQYKYVTVVSDGTNWIVTANN